MTTNYGVKQLSIDTATNLPFFVYYSSTDAPVTGLTEGSFNIDLVDPSGNVEAGTFYTVTEVDGTNAPGYYTLDFTPDEAGQWFLRMYYDGTPDDWQGVWTLDVASGPTQEILGLEGSNSYIDNMTYHVTFRKLTGARVRIYDKPANVGTATGVLATYTVTATYDSSTGKLETYKLTKS